MSSDITTYEGSVHYILTLRDSSSGGFSFTRGTLPTLMGTAYAIHGLEFLGSLDLLSPIEQKQVIRFLMRCSHEDGTFRDPLFNSAQIATGEHDDAYFDNESTCFAQQALDALNAPPPPRRIFPDDLLTPQGLCRAFDAYDWSNPHLNSNRVMFWMAQLVHEVERQRRRDLLPLVDAGLDWLDAHQSPETGLWLGPVPVPLSAAMAATFHFTFFYAYRKRPLLYLDRIIDSCLSLQKSDGLFARDDCVGQTCLDYDALDLLAKACLSTNYRQNDIVIAFQTAHAALTGLLNADGGYANVKQRRVANTWIPAPGLYHTGLRICSCDNQDSNVFSTWFRLLALTLCKQFDLENNTLNHFQFRRLPWLGYHDVHSIPQSHPELTTQAFFHCHNTENSSLSKKTSNKRTATTSIASISTGATMTAKSVSVIIAATSSVNSLEQFISSFFFINTYTPIELIVNHDVREDVSGIIRSHGSKCFIRQIKRNQTESIVQAAGSCATMARHDYLFFVSDQSDYTVDVLDSALAALDTPETGVVCGNFDAEVPSIVSQLLATIDQNNANDLDTKTVVAFSKSFLLCRKSTFFEMQGFDITQENGREKVEFCSRLYRDKRKNSICLSDNAPDKSKTKKNHRLIGAIDTIKSNKLYGWIADDQNLNKQLEVSLYIDEKLVGSKKANLYRNDIQKNSIESGKHGVIFDIGYSFLDGREHRVKIQANSDQEPLGALMADMTLPRLLAAPENIGNFAGSPNTYPKVSIVVPAFNVENFISEALLSLIEQTLEDIEIVIVNDGSTDKTGDICEYYMNIDNRIRYIDLFENKGYGHACNLGIKAARGEYVAILEPDDFVDKDTYRYAYENGAQKNLDWVRFGFVFFCEGKSRTSSYLSVIKQHKIPLNKSTNINEYMGIYPSQPTVWGFIYNRKFLIDNDIWFLETPGASYQDNSFWYKILSLSKKVMLLDKECYYYRQHPDQSVHNVTKVTAPIIELAEMKRFCECVLKGKYPDKSYKLLYLQVINRTIDYFEIQFKRLRLDLKAEFYEHYLKFINEILFQNKDREFYCSHLIERRKKLLNEVTTAKTYEEYIYKKNLYPVKGELSDFKNSKILEQHVRIERVTPVFQNMFFGYFDIQATDTKSKCHLALRVPFMDRLPTSKDFADICLVDSSGKIDVIDKTNCWNFQQGNLLQFLPGSDENIIFNFFDEYKNKYSACIYNIKNKKKMATFPLPIANVSPKGDMAVSINFSRMYNYRPGYGYSNIVDPFFEQKAPKNDGIFIINLATKKANLLVSYAQLWEMFAKGTSVENDKILVNHINFNPEGSKLIFLLRFFSNTAPWPTHTVVMDSNGTNIHRVFGFGSHYHWKNNFELIVAGEDIFHKKDRKFITAHILDAKTGNNNSVDESFFIGDGHCSYSPCRRYVLYDSYSSLSDPYKNLMIYDMERERGLVLARLFSDHNLYNNIVDIRCDLHPRWTFNNEYITFDSIHEGFRGIYRIKVADAIKALEADTENIKYKKISPAATTNTAPLVFTPSKVIDPKVSIGIPLFNTEKYLKNCLDTVLGQSLSDIEILLVDDCSPDNSLEIAQEYQKMDSRIHILKHPRNLGLGGVRNTCIYNAKAPYLGMIDSDDLIEKDMYKIMYDKAVAHNADMVVCGIKKIYENDPEKVTDFVKYNEEQIILDCFDYYMKTDRIIPAVYQKLFKRDVLVENKIMFPNYVYHQDIATIPKIVYFCNKIVLLKEQLYYYMQRNGSAVSSISPRHIDSVCTIIRSVKNFLQEKGLYDKYKRNFFEEYFFKRSIKFHFLRIANNAESKIEMTRLLKESINRLLNEIDLTEILSIIDSKDIRLMLK